MRLGLLSLTQGLFLNSILLGNISSIENNFTYSFIALNQDTTFEAHQDTTFKDSTSIVSMLSIPRAKFKSPIKAMLYFNSNVATMLSTSGLASGTLAQHPLTMSFKRPRAAANSSLITT